MGSNRSSHDKNRNIVCQKEQQNFAFQDDATQMRRKKKRFSHFCTVLAFQYGLTCFFVLFFFVKMCVDAARPQPSLSRSLPLSLVLLAQPELGPPAQASCAPGQASSP